MPSPFACDVVIAMFDKIRHAIQMVTLSLILKLPTIEYIEVIFNKEHIKEQKVHTSKQKRVDKRGPLFRK